MAPLLTCQDLSLGYEGRVIISDLSFTVESGDYLCIVGENGSGKSTLMRTLLGLQAPLSGKVVYGEGMRRDRVGYLPQRTDAQEDFPATVWEIVLSGRCGRLGKRPFYGREDRAAACANIEKMGLSDLKNRCFRELSGGQQQRVLLARALCAADRILLLDEPVSGLDPKVTAEMYEIIADLNRKEGLTVIMISHDLEAALRYADHVLHVGKTLFYGSRDDYLQSGFTASFRKGGDGK